VLDIESRISAALLVFYGVPGSGCPDMPLCETARQVADAGFGVEVFIGETWEKRPLPSDETIAQIAEACRAAKIISTHACVNRWDPETFRKEVLISATMGATQMVIHPYALGQDIEGLTPDTQAARDLCSFALDNGVLLVLENLGKTGITSLRQSLDMIGTEPKKTGLGICIDVGHAHRSCSTDCIRPEAFLSEFGDLIYELHVHDNIGDKDLHRPPGQGTIDWPPVVQAMCELRDDAVICLEMVAKDRPIQALHDSREFLLSFVPSETVNCKL